MYIVAVVGTLALFYWASGKVHGDTAAPVQVRSETDVAVTNCRYAVRERLPKGADITWSDPSPSSVKVEADGAHRVTLLYRVGNAGGARPAACRMRHLGGDEWRLLSVE